MWTALMASLAASFEAAGITAARRPCAARPGPAAKPAEGAGRRRAAGWEDAVRQACAVLVQAGDVTENSPFRLFKACAAPGRISSLCPA